MDWIIEPYVGVGPLKFGMSPEEVSEILGEAESTNPSAPAFAGDPILEERFKNHFSEYRLFGNMKTAKPTIQYDNDKLESIDFHKSNSTLQINGLLLFKQTRKAILHELYLMDKEIRETTGGYLFMNLGISLSGPESYSSNPPIGVFAKGVFDLDIIELDYEKLDSEPDW